MAGYNDSEGPYTEGAPGFFNILSHVTDITNKFDKDATPASGDGLIWNGSVYYPMPPNGVNAARFASSGVINTAAFNSAVAATPAGGTLFLPKALTYSLATPVSTITDINITSDGATLTFTADAGAGTWGLPISGSGNYPLLYMENFFVVGPGTRGAMGTAPCNMHGLRLSSTVKVQFRNVTVKLFNRGIDLNTTTGHIYFLRCNLTDNFYGLYLTNNSSDYFVTDSEFNGNLFAGIAMPADQGFDGLVIQNSHIGFQPYGIFQESTPTSQGSPKVFIQDAILQHARFEAIGNGAIVSEATVDASNKSSLNAVKIIQPGFSWNTGTYKIAARNQNYAIDVGFFERTLEIESGTFPFTSGATNVYRIDQADSAGYIALRGTTSQVSASQFSIGTGAPTIQIGGVPLLVARSETTTWNPASIATGAATSTTVTVTGAAIGDIVVPSFSLAVPAGVILTANVTATNTATVTLANLSGSTVDLGSGTLRVRWTPT